MEDHELLAAIREDDHWTVRDEVQRRGPLPPLEGVAALVHAAAAGAAEVAMVLMVSGRADPNERDADGMTALHHARTAAVCKQLIVGGADVNATTPGGLTPLQAAVARDLPTVVRALLAAGAR